MLLVDEWIETGAQMRAAIEVMERLEATVVGIAALCVDNKPANLELLRRYETFAANCFRCKKLDCQVET